MKKNWLVVFIEIEYKNVTPMLEAWIDFAF